MIIFVKINFILLLLQSPRLYFKGFTETQRNKSARNLVGSTIIENDIKRVKVFSLLLNHLQ